IVDDGIGHRSDRADRIDRRREALGIANDSLHVAVADRLGIDRGRGRAVLAPVADDPSFRVDDAMKRRSGLLRDGGLVLDVHGVRPWVQAIFEYRRSSGAAASSGTPRAKASFTCGVAQCFTQ